MNKKPNIIFVLTDDQGYGDLGCTGNPIVKTPNIDGFYEESVRLTNYHVGPTCAPTRSGLMTGHYANSAGVWHTVGGRSLLRREEWTIADALKESGYKTGIFGKWHLGDEYPYRPMDRGFQKSIVHGGGGISQTPDYWGNDYFDDTYFVDGEPQKFSGYCTDVFFGEALEFIEENKSEPFFCCITTNAPHDPFNVANKYSDPYSQQVANDRARFYGMITNIDDNFGVLRKKLEELELQDNTILIFMTDNGSCGGVTIDSREYVVDGFNAGLRGKKNSPYDGGHRVPFFIRWPNGSLRHGKDINELTANIDFMPTLLDLCDVPVKEGAEFHGTSLKPLLYSECDWSERVIVTDSQRLAYPMKWRKSAVMTNRWRLINGEQLYDIIDDREQRLDIASKYPDVVESLRQSYSQWWNIVSKQFDVDIPFVFGKKPISITSHDMRNQKCVTAWHQVHIREGIPVSGYWEVEVEEDGCYQIELRRWPKSENREIASGIDGDDIEFSREFIQEKNWRFYTGGEALAIENASIIIDGIQQSVHIADDDTAAVFNVNLSRGRARLQAWFSNGRDESIAAAYYIDVCFGQN